MFFLRIFANLLCLCSKIQDATKPDKKIVDMDRLKQDVDWSGSGSPSQLLDAVYDVHSYNAR